MRIRCNDPPGGASGSAAGSAPVRPPLLCACSLSLAGSRLLVNILGTRFYSYNSSTRRLALSLFAALILEGFRRRGATG
ncbi:hypothetical protein T08_9762 [Trichinella sp. T8]|nr:hypothetical protein T08_9762 [Trichinella sp. T8]